VQYVDSNDKIGRHDIYLLKEKKIFGRIRAEYYSNMSDLVSALENGIERERAKRTSA
jgi:hypothetical protein